MVLALASFSNEFYTETVSRRNESSFILLRSIFVNLYEMVTFEKELSPCM